MVSGPQSLESTRSSGSNSVCPGDSLSRLGCSAGKCRHLPADGPFSASQGAGRPRPHDGPGGGHNPSWPVGLNVAQIETGHVLDEQIVFLQGLQLGGATLTLAWTRTVGKNPVMIKETDTAHVKWFSCQTDFYLKKKLNWSIADAHDYISYRCTLQWFTIFKPNWHLDAKDKYIIQWATWRQKVGKRVGKTEETCKFPQKDLVRHNREQRGPGEGQSWCPVTLYNTFARNV